MLSKPILITMPWQWKIIRKFPFPSPSFSLLKHFFLSSDKPRKIEPTFHNCIQSMKINSLKKKKKLPFCAFDGTRWMWTRCEPISGGEAWRAHLWAQPPPRWFLRWFWFWFPSSLLLSWPSSPPKTTSKASETTPLGDERQCSGKRVGIAGHWRRTWGLARAVLRGM